jgi:hypothetical protein
MTKTSEGPAGMSIEIIASLFCYVNKSKDKLGQIEKRISIFYPGRERDEIKYLCRLIGFNKAQLERKYPYLENHFCSCHILISWPKNLLNLQISGERC